MGEGRSTGSLHFIWSSPENPVCDGRQETIVSRVPAEIHFRFFSGPSAPSPRRRGLERRCVRERKRGERERQEKVSTEARRRHDVDEEVAGVVDPGEQEGEVEDDPPRRRPLKKPTDEGDDDPRGLADDEYQSNHEQRPCQPSVDGTPSAVAVRTAPADEHRKLVSIDQRH